MSHTVNASKKNTSKKAKALLAGGLVLGVGAAVTLASWTDEEWASASFSSGKFELESSIDGESFNRPTGDGAALNFDLDIAENLAPGQELAAPFALRLSADTSHDAVVTMDGPSREDYIEGLEYGLAEVGSAAECNTELDFKSISSSFYELEAGDSNEAGEAQFLCFYVSASETLAQGESATPTWAFHAALPDSAN